jgi:geranylgeranyl pyrophosphate synthase
MRHKSPTPLHPLSDAGKPSHERSAARIPISRHATAILNGRETLMSETHSFVHAEAQSSTVGNSEHQRIADGPFSWEIAQLRDMIASWIGDCDQEMREPLEWQFLFGSKYFRPLTIFSCYQAMCGDEIPNSTIRSAALLELFHNVTLIIDDILDGSELRRGRPTLHTKFGQLSALMTSGYIVADGYQMAGDDLQAISLFSELLKRLGVAECLQWRLRRQPLGVQDWRMIAGEDTGSMFEIAACLGDRTGHLRKFGALLGLLYHGCDDVADVRGTTALGGGGYDDLRDGILTLPAALAIREPAISRIFCSSGDRDLEALAEAFRANVPEAESYLDMIADDAKAEARLFARNPDPLFALVDRTRPLSGR